MATKRWSLVLSVVLLGILVYTLYAIYGTAHTQECTSSFLDRFACQTCVVDEPYGQCLGYVTKKSGWVEFALQNHAYTDQQLIGLNATINSTQCNLTITRSSQEDIPLPQNWSPLRVHTFRLKCPQGGIADIDLLYTVGESIMGARGRVEVPK